jgi:hypothetical protein
MKTHTLLALASLMGVCVAQAHAPSNGMSSRLPLGDGKFSQSPKKGFVFACSTRFPGGGGAHRAGEWIKDGFWDPSKTPLVDGNVMWPNSEISISVEGEQRVVRANNLPKHATGEYPIARGSKAFEYDRNPNAIKAQTIVLQLPAQPTLLESPACVPMGMVGFALSGVAIFNAFDLAGRDAPAYEIQDKCNGHPERGGQYHYHDWSPCLPDQSGDAGAHNDLAGFMLDGLPIFGPKGEGGKALTSDDLDECHGHTHEVTIEGKTAKQYHYHFTRDYPYTIGCFRAKPQRR